LHIDVETYSSEDITKVGAYKYCRSIDFEILMVAYAFDNEPIQIVDLASGEELPAEFIDALEDPEVVKCAHNANFERNCFAQIGYEIPPEEWECTAIKAAYCGLPLSLKNVSYALQLGEDGKHAEGKALIRYFSIPCRPTKANGQRRRNLPHHDPEKWQRFKDYCVGDVHAERTIDHRLAKYTFPEQEQLMYVLDQRINDRGVLIDLTLAENAILLDSQNTAQLAERAREITGLENPNSPAQLKRWLTEAMKMPINSLAKNVLADLIQLAGAGAAGEVLRIRRKMSKSSVKKYTAMQSCVCDDGRARGLFQYYGANRTGRWAGRLIQLQNLPQNKIRELTEARALFRTGSLEDVQLVYDDVGNILSQLIRTALVAPEGKAFAVADFSAIEARVIAWLAGEQWRLDVFNGHGQIYEASASMMFGLPIEQCQKVEKGGRPGIRAKGKVAELALGYQGSVGALRTMGGERMGLVESEMKAIVEKWREANPAIVKLWKQVEACAMQAMKTRRVIEHKSGLLRFHYNGESLRIQLPSGRALCYWRPVFGKNKFEKQCIKYRGTVQATRQWGYIDTYGGKLVENIVQAVARDLLAFSLRELDAEGFEIVMHVHDEAVCEIDTLGQAGTLETMCEIMAQNPSWSTGLPLAADGYLTPFYKKD